MKIYLNDLEKDRGNFVNYHFLVSPEMLSIEEENFVIKELITLNISASYTGRELIIKGSFKTRIGIHCSRCLDYFNLLLEGDFLERFQHSSHMEMDIEEMNIIDKNSIIEGTIPGEFMEGEAFHLDKILRDNVFLALPLKPLCSENCKGLCLSCGENLNHADCGCKIESIDPRLEGLKNYFKE
ncbi:MAG: DUF177 domain-containing protein [Candidatus Syntrophonatronum acetioxidans]|uniref:DUF177 domain-containing protein n=1 Tax=Candidatus Syntrophonatronum acetioxidans TaxID=1795816 RepID=A0A424YHV3_9FIRM|nr:MAG: DUF177 domain-containing protein [Candidatus Syntrophonatronum acetioxidans]